MNENNTVSMYEAVPVVSELNQVPGFNPLKFLRRTKDGDWKLDLKIKKLWFRLKYPTGRIKLSALKITDQLAIIEARVYFDKNDAQPAASFTAQRENKTTPGGLYIESAQHRAIDEALSAAGFGIQFIPAKEAETVSARQIPAAMQEPAKQETITAREISTPPSMTPVETAGTAPSPVQETVKEEQAAEEIPAEEIQAAVSESTKEPLEEVPAPVQAEETVLEEDTESHAEETVEAAEVHEEPMAVAYTKETPVDEICAQMTVEEAGNIIVPAGTCKGWTLSQVADRRPVSLKWYLTGYSGDDNILRAGAKIMQTVVEARKAS